MWLEVKATITIIGSFILAVIVALSGNLLFAGLCTMAIATFIFGDLLVGWKIVSTDAIHMIDPVGLGEKIINLHLIGGGQRLIKSKKAPLGKWEFLFHKKKCSVIDDGSYPTRLPNGNPCILAHESRDRSINLKTAKALQVLFNKYNVSNIKALYYKLKEKEKELEKEASTKNGDMVDIKEDDDPHKKVQRITDKVTAGESLDTAKKDDFDALSLSPELKIVRNNLLFLAELLQNPIKKDAHKEEVFGCETVDPLTQVYGDNIWNRSIYIVDELCDMNESATIEQRLKYLKKKRKEDPKLMFLLLLLAFGGLAIVLLWFLLPMFMG